MNARRMPWWLVMILIAVFAVSCGKQVKQVDNEALEEEFKHAPEWVLDGYQEGMISAVGSAKIGKGGLQFARNEALANGRTELARQVSVKIRSLVNNFAQQTGIGDDQMVDAFSKQVTRQVTNETLAGSKQQDLWISPSSDVYVLVVMDAAEVKASVKKGVVTSFQQDEARWQEFKAKNGNEELDKEIEATFDAAK